MRRRCIAGGRRIGSIVVSVLASSGERSELARARRRTRELETELEMARKASALVAAGAGVPKMKYPVVLPWPEHGFEIKR